MSPWPRGWRGHEARAGGGRAGLQQTALPRPQGAWHERLLIVIIPQCYSSGGFLLRRRHRYACPLRAAILLPSICGSLLRVGTSEGRILHCHPSGRAAVCLSARSPLSLHTHRSAHVCLPDAQLPELFIALLAAFPDPPPSLQLPISGGAAGGWRGVQALLPRRL